MSVLELCFQRDLPLSGNIVGERTEDSTCDSRTIDATIRIREVRVIQEVKRLRPKLHAEYSGMGKVLKNDISICQMTGHR
jgi:hypothetical protein